MTEILPNFLPNSPPIYTMKATETKYGLSHRGRHEKNMEGANRGFGLWLVGHGVFAKLVGCMAPAPSPVAPLMV